MKVAIVDMIRVLDQSKLGLAGAKQLEGLYHQQQRELAPLIQTAQAAAKKRQPNDPSHKLLEQKAREHESEREKLRVELREALLARAQPIIQKLSAERDVDFVLAKPQALLFAKPELDLTGEVITALDH